MQTKKEPLFKKGPVAAEIQAQIEADFLAGKTEAYLSEHYMRSPKVIARILQALAMRPRPTVRATKVTLEFEYRSLTIKTPNGGTIELRLPVGMDATNNTIVLESIQRFLEVHKAQTDENNLVKESEK